MADTLTTTAAGVNNDLQVYFDKAVLKNATYQTKLDQFGRKTKVPQHGGTTIQFVQYNELDPVSSTLTEGVAPDAIGLTTSKITATLDQLGSVIKLTDLAGLTPKHDAVQNALRLLGTQAARSYDLKVNSVLGAGTGVIYSNGKTARTGLAAGDVAKMADFANAVTNLRNNGASEFSDGNFVAVIDPTTEMNLMKDPDFRDAAIRNGLGTKGEVYKGEIATFNGVRFVRSNNVPTISSTVPVHVSYIFGQDAYGVTDWQSLQTYREGPGGVNDPLHQIMTLGWKVAFKAAILNNKFMQRVESAGV